MADQEARLRITAVDATREAFRSVAKNLNALDRGAVRLGRGFAALAAAGGIGAVFTDAVRRATEAERAINQLNATLKATGFSAGQTSADVQALAAQLSKASVFDDDAILAGINALLRFRDVQGEVFRDAVKLLPDVAAGLGVDLVQAAQALGRALNEPGEGLKQLRAAGVKLSESQIELAQRLRESGDLAGAQRLVIEEITKSLGGVAGAENQGLYGATKSVAKSYDEMLKAFARSTAIKDSVVGVLGAVTATIEAIDRLDQRLKRDFDQSAGVRGARLTAGDVRRLDNPADNERRAASAGQAARRAEQLVEAEAERARNRRKSRATTSADAGGELLAQLEREKLGLRDLSRETEILAQLETARYAKVGPAQRALIAQRAQEVDAIKEAQRILEEQADSERQATDLAVQQAQEITRQLREENEQYTQRAEAIRRSIDPVRELKQEMEAARDAFSRGFIDLDELQAFEQKIGRDMQSALDDTAEATKRATREFDEFKSTTASALEEAIVKFDSLRDVINGLGQDILRMAVRRGIVNPLMDALFGGGPGVAGGTGGAFGSFIGELFQGFAGGGKFTVGGTGGTDSQLVAFRATPGEQVSVSRPGQGRGGSVGTSVVMNVYAQDANSFRRSQRQILGDLRLQLARTAG